MTPRSQVPPYCSRVAWNAAFLGVNGFGVVEPLSTKRSVRCANVVSGVPIGLWTTGLGQPVVKETCAFPRKGTPGGCLDLPKPSFEAFLDVSLKRGAGLVVCLHILNAEEEVRDHASEHPAAKVPRGAGEEPEDGPQEGPAACLQVWVCVCFPFVHV